MVRLRAGRSAALADRLRASTMLPWIWSDRGLSLGQGQVDSTSAAVVLTYWGSMEEHQAVEHAFVEDKAAVRHA